MVISVQPNNFYAVEHICRFLRQVDAEEIYPLMPDDNPLTLATHTHHALRIGHGSIVWYDGLPAALCGLHPLHGNVSWQVFTFGTDAFKTCANVVLRELRKNIREVLDTYPEAMRMQADSHENHHEAHAWIQRLHGVKEAEMPFYGRDNATYYRFAWIVGQRAFNRYIKEAA